MITLHSHPGEQGGPIGHQVDLRVRPGGQAEDREPERGGAQEGDGCGSRSAPPGHSGASGACRSRAGGGRSALAADALREMGCRSVAHLEPGFGGWQKAGEPLEDVRSTSRWVRRTESQPGGGR